MIDCPAGQRKHDLAEEYLAKTRVTQGLFLVLVGRAQAPVWDVSAKHHIERKKPMLAFRSLSAVARTITDQWQPCAARDIEAGSSRRL
jgi:hypothetical protein